MKLGHFFRTLSCELLAVRLAKRPEGPQGVGPLAPPTTARPNRLVVKRRHWRHWNRWNIVIRRTRTRGESKRIRSRPVWSRGSWSARRQVSRCVPRFVASMRVDAMFALLLLVPSVLAIPIPIHVGSFHAHGFIIGVILIVRSRRHDLQRAKGAWPKCTIRRFLAHCPVTQRNTDDRWHLHGRVVEVSGRISPGDLPGNAVVPVCGALRLLLLVRRLLAQARGAQALGPQL